jgi:hypothetical protein
MTPLEVAAHIVGWIVSVALVVAFVVTLVVIDRKDHPRE